MKKIIPLLSLFLVLSSCSPVETGDENIIDTSNFNSVQKVLHKLTDNNFTVNFTSRLANNSMKELNVTYKYNPNYVMVSGDADNYNYMTKDDTLFKFSFDNSGEIVPSAPLISYTTGLRYESFYDYRIGFNDFNASEANLVLGNDFKQGDDIFLIVINDIISAIYNCNKYNLDEDLETFIKN